MVGAVRRRSATASECYYEYLAGICGMGGFPTGVPNQWWRFILPIFLHVGFIDLTFMVVFQVCAVCLVGPARASIVRGRRCANA